MDLERARRILELKAGATFREVSEAREDLLALWNADRMSDHPRLRAKAARKVDEINQAYDILMEHLSRGGAPAASAPEQPAGATPRESSGDSSAASTVPDHTPRASLYEEVFRREKPGGRHFPIWAVAGALILLVAAIVFFPFPNSDNDAGSLEPDPSQSLAGPGESVLPGGQVPQASDEPDPETDATSAPEPDQPSSPAVKQPEPSVQAAAPPPPATPPARKLPPAATRQPPSPSRSASPRPGAERPALRRETSAARSTEGAGERRSAGESDEGQEEAQRQRAQQFERVFRDLLAGSPAARKLVDEGYPGLRFQQWNVVSETASEIWIELVASTPEGKTVHYTWAINPADGETRALSAAARDLEGSGSD